MSPRMAAVLAFFVHVANKLSKSMTPTLCGIHFGTSTLVPFSQAKNELLPTRSSRTSSYYTHARNLKSHLLLVSFKTRAPNLRNTYSHSQQQITHFSPEF